jgi:hypothetical protein
MELYEKANEYLKLFEKSLGIWILKTPTDKELDKFYKLAKFLEKIEYDDNTKYKWTRDFLNYIVNKKIKDLNKIPDFKSEFNDNTGLEWFSNSDYNYLLLDSCYKEKRFNNLDDLVRYAINKARVEVWNLLLNFFKTELTNKT